MNPGTFVGRRAEMERLDAFWAEALGGRARVCFVAGEPGAGKTTLVAELSRRVQRSHPDAAVITGACDARTGRSDAYLPFLTLLDQLTGDPDGAAPRGAQGAEGARRLGKAAGFSVRAVLEHAPDLVGTLIPAAGLLLKAGIFAAREAGLVQKLEERVQGSAGAAAPALDRERLFGSYTDLLRAVSANVPLLLVVDDLQWADGASLDLFFHLARSLGESRILLVGTYRPNDLGAGRDGERHPLEPVLHEIRRYDGDVVVDLDRADEAERRAWVDALLDSEPNALGPAFRQALLRHTGGHPLFTVELLRTLQERSELARDAERGWTASGALDWSVLPSRVEGVIAERVGRLEDRVRELLTVASVEGASFTTQVLARLQEMRERELLRLLSGELEKRHRLVVEGATERVGRGWVAQFSFSHVVLQQYLYNDLSARERMLLHGEVAALLEELYEGETERVSMQLARHWDVAGEPERAVDHYLARAAAAMRVSACAEARELLERCRELLDDAPPGPERNARELAVLTPLCTVVAALEGWASPSLTALHYRSRELARELGDRGQLARLLFGLWAFHLVRLELGRALEICRECFDLADALAEQEPVLQAHAIMANTLFWLGRPVESLEYAEAALRLCAPDIRESHLARFGVDPRMIPLMFVAYAGWVAGRVGEAAAAAEEAVRIGEEGGHPFSHALGINTAASLGHVLRDPAYTRRHAAALVELAERLGFPFYRGHAAMLLGWATARQGAVEEGMRGLEEGFQAAAEHGGRAVHSQYRLMQAEVLLEQGRPAEALEAVESGLAVVEECDERAYEADLHRMRAEVLARLDPQDAQAAAAARRALAVARAQGAAMLELRAATTLARLGGDPSPLPEALARVRAPEDNPDVQDARALLDGVSAPS